MKKLILPLLLVVSFLFAGFNKANASAFKIAASTAAVGTTAGVNGLVANPVPAGSTNYATYGFQLVSSGTTTGVGNITSLTFYQSGSSSDNNNAYYTTAYLYYCTTSNYSTGTTTLLSTAAATTGFYQTFSGLSIAASNTVSPTGYYFIVLSNNLGDTNTLTFQWELYSGTFTNTSGSAPTFTTSAPGPSYTFAAAAVTATAASLTTTAGSAGLSTPATISTVGNYTVYGMSLTPSATGTTKALTGLTFTTSGAPSQFNNYFYGTAYLYASNNSSYDGTAVQISTVTTAGNNTLAFTGFTTAQSITAGTTKYYYVVIVYSTGVAATATQTLTLTGTTSTATVTISASAAGPSYSYSPPPYALTLTSLTNVAGNNGLSATPVAYGSTNYSVYGFQLLGAGGTGSTSITSLTFNQNGTSTDFNNLYYTTAYLYSNTTNSFATGTKTLVATTTAIGSNSIVFTPGTAIAATNTTNTYYFIVLSNTLGDNNANTFRLAYSTSSVTGTAITAATGTPGVQGPAYTFSPQPPTTVTFTSYGSASTTGLSSSPVLALQNNLAIDGFTLTGSGSGTSQTVTSLTFATSLATNALNNAFFTSVTLYRSTTSSTFSTATATAVPGATAALGANYNNIVLTPTTPLVVPASTTATTWYFLVVNYTIASTSTTNDTYELDYQTGTNGSGTALTSGTTTTGYNYVFPPLTITATDVTAGLSPVPNSNIYQGQSNLALAGEGLATTTSGTTATLSQLTFNFTPTALATANSYFANPPVLYSSTSATFSTSTATPVTGATGVVTAGVITFTLSSAVTLNSTPTYFYLVLNYSVTGGTVPQVYTFTPKTYTTSFSTTAGTTGFGSNTYTCSPPVVVAASSTNGFSPTTIVAAQTGLALYGFSLSSYNANTFTTFSFTSTGTIGNINNNFANLVLYSSATNDFTTATPVTDPYVITPSTLNSTSFTITNLLQSISNSTVYYFLVLDCTAIPATGTVTFTPTLSSIATSTTTYNTAGAGFPLTGQTYTLKQPAPYTYYWYGAGATTDWKNPANWITNTTNYTNAGSYPGATTSDVAAFNYIYYYTGVNAYPSIGAYNINVAQFNVIYYNDVYLTVNSAYSLTTPILTIGNTTNKLETSLTIYGTTTGTTSLFNATGTTSLGYESYLYVPATGVISFPSATSITLNGNKADPATIEVEGGTLTITSTPVNLIGIDASIYTTSGTTTINNSTVTMSGNSTEILNSGGTTNFLGSTLNITGTVGSYLVGVSNSGGTFNIGPYVVGGVTTNSTINLGTTAANGASAYLENTTGGTMNITGATVNANGTGTTIYNVGAAGTLTALNVNSSTINLGTSTTTGTNSEIYNSEEGIFYLNANSIINMNGAGANIFNTPTTVGGSPYYGVFVCASTSVINPNSTTAIVSNSIANTVPNAGSYFTFLSDANATATIGKLATGATLSGPFNVQRYLNGGQYYLRNYRLLSSPVNVSSATSSSTNLVALGYLGASAAIPYTSTTFNGAFIAGPGATFGGGIHSIANPLLYLYQENIVPGTAYNAQFTSGKNVGVISLSSSSSTVGTLSTAAGAGSGSGTTSPSVASTAIALPAYDNNTAGTDAIPPGNAYLLYYIDNNARTDAASAQDIPGASNVTASGYINQGQVQLFMWGSISGNLTDTYGLSGVRLPGITEVGNPYPSTIDLKQVYLDNSTTITPSLYQLDNTTQQFNTYNASTNISSTSLSSEYIASGLGFYIHVDSLGSKKTFYFQEDQKTPSATGGFFPPISEYSVITPTGPTVDNLNLPTGPGKANDNLSAAKSSSKTYAVTENNSESSANIVSQNSLSGSLNTMALVTPPPPGKKPTAVPIPYAPALTVPVATAPPSGPTETPEIRPAPPVAAIANPAGLHLKFVVDSVNNDEIGVYFNKAWSDNYDQNDSYDLDGQSGKVYLSSYTANDVRTSINALGDYTGGKRVKLFVKASTAGIFQLQMSNIQNFDTNDYSVFLLDKLKADSLDLTLYKSYNFNYAPGTANDSTRFVLAIEHKPVPYYALLTFAGQKVTPGVQLNWQTKNLGGNTTFVLQKLNAGNVYVAIDSLESDSSGEFNYIDQHPTLGNNTYRLEQINELGVITYSAPVTIGYNSTNPNGGLVLYPNPAKSTMTVTLTTSSVAVQVATADIYNTSGKLIEHKVVNSNSFVHDVSGYALGAYIIELKNSNGVVVGQSKFVKVN